MKRNVNDALTAISLLLTLTGIQLGQSLPQPLMPSSEKAKDERYVGQLLWSQLIPRLHEASVDDLRLNVADENEDVDGIAAKNSSPATAKGNASHRPSGGNVGEGSELEVGSYRVQRRKEKRYKLSFYDCIALYCQELQGDDRNSCILNSCNRSRYWPRK